LIAGPVNNIFRQIIKINDKFANEYIEFKLESNIVSIAYNEYLDIYLFGCGMGCVYIYDPMKNSLKLVMNNEKYGDIRYIICLNDNEFIFVPLEIKSENIVNMDNNNKMGNLFCFGNILTGEVNEYYHKNDISYIHKDKNRNVFYVGDDKGYISLYNITPIGPKLLDRIEGHKGTSISCISDCEIKKSKKIVTSGELDGIVKIWDIVNQKLRLLKTIRSDVKKISQIIYLKLLNMIVCAGNQINFYDIYSGDQIPTNIDYVRQIVIDRNGYDKENIVSGNVFLVDSTTIGIGSNETDEIQIVSILCDEVDNMLDYIATTDLLKARFYLDCFCKYLHDKHYPMQILSCLSGMVLSTHKALNNSNENFNLHYFWNSYSQKCENSNNNLEIIINDFYNAMIYANKKSKSRFYLDNFCEYLYKNNYPRELLKCIYEMSSTVNNAFNNNKNFDLHYFWDIFSKKCGNHNENNINNGMIEDFYNAMIYANNKL